MAPAINKLECKSNTELNYEYEIYILLVFKNYIVLLKILCKKRSWFKCLRDNRFYCSCIINPALLNNFSAEVEVPGIIKYFCMIYEMGEINELIWFNDNSISIDYCNCINKNQFLLSTNLGKFLHVLFRIIMDSLH